MCVCLCVSERERAQCTLASILQSSPLCPGVTGHLLLLLFVPAAAGQTQSDIIPGSLEGRLCFYNPENLIKKLLSFRPELEVN